MIEYIKDRYLTWKTGFNKEHRDWHQWVAENIVVTARTVENMYMNFNYIIEVNPDTFLNLEEPFTWVPCEDASQYMHPARKLGENCVWTIQRVRKDQWDGRWHMDDLGGGDHVFVATNNEKDATMIALRWS